MRERRACASGASHAAGRRMGPIDAIAQDSAAARHHVARRRCPRCGSRPTSSCWSTSARSTCGWRRRCAQLGYAGPILYYFPPAAWLDNEARAREVAAVTDAADRVRASARLLPVPRLADRLLRPSAGVDYRGASAARAAPPADGGIVALLPGSRRGEIDASHAALLDALAAAARRGGRACGAVFGAADARGERAVRARARACAASQPVRSCAARAPRSPTPTRAAVASGTAVLEAGARQASRRSRSTVMSDARQRSRRARLSKARYITLPNLVLGRDRSCPNCCKRTRRPSALAAALEPLLADPAQQLASLRRRARGARAARRARPLRVRLALAMAGRADAASTTPPICTTIAAYRGAAARAARPSGPGLLVDCGDALRGSQTVYHRREPIVDEIDAAGYDVQAIGNREFHYLFGWLARARAQDAPSARVRELASTRAGRALPFVRPMRDAFDDGAARARASGLLVMQYPVGSPWERDLRLAVSRSVGCDRAARASACPTARCWSRSRTSACALDRELAQRVPRLDLILGGHSHDTLFAPEFVDGVPIVHAGPYGALRLAHRACVRCRARALRDRRFRARAAARRARDRACCSSPTGTARPRSPIASRRNCARSRRRLRTRSFCARRRSASARGFARRRAAAARCPAAGSSRWATCATSRATWARACWR